ncbi:hypothetical protein AKO1_011336 [Acrasis kona]|uniref:Uncharacterized protein n=1 Tax=Acrasis kona TaxID=1008807 RepID=A0AAW2YXM0_9EUKA
MFLINKYLIDTSNPSQMASSCIEGLNLIKSIKNKRFLFLLNKSDAPSTYSKSTFERMIRWNDVVKNDFDTHQRHRLDIMECSAYDGNNLKEVINWMFS